MKVRYVEIIHKFGFEDDYYSDYSNEDLIELALDLSIYNEESATITITEEEEGE